MCYQIQVVWNREFHWSNYHKPVERLEQAIKLANDVMDSGDGARVKKARVVDQEENVILGYI